MQPRRAKSTFEAIIATGRRPIGTFIFTNDPSTTAIFGSSGYDWVVIDREHGTMDLPGLLGHIRAAQATGTVPLVRVLENSPTLIQQSLDLGAQGVIIPKIATADDARRAVIAARYAPGGRGMCPGVPATNFTYDGWNEYRDDVNENILVIPIIETMEGVQNAEEICDVEGIDYVFFGFADLAQDIGADMYADQEMLSRHWEHVAAMANRHGVRAGAPLGVGFDQIAQFGVISGDVDILRTAASEKLAAFRNAESRIAC